MVIFYRFLPKLCFINPKSLLYYLKEQRWVFDKYPKISSLFCFKIVRFWSSPHPQFVLLFSSFVLFYSVVFVWFHFLLRFISICHYLGIIFFSYFCSSFSYYCHYVLLLSSVFHHHFLIPLWYIGFPTSVFLLSSFCHPLILILLLLFTNCVLLFLSFSSILGICFHCQ